MRILAIETSCDETALAIIEASGGLRAPKFKILENIVASQIKIHRPFGGVVPNLAKREHLKNLPILLEQIEKKHKNPWNDIDLIAVTVGPGLEPALWTGITFAQELARECKKPLIGANHLEGHLYSFLLPQKPESYKSKVINQKLFPAIALIVSGGHTILLKLASLSKWKKLGETRDDAAGECFDKIARLLALPYPGGPEIEKLAKKGDSNAITFPRPMLNQKNYDFSFSGIKTSVLYYLRDHPKVSRADVAASAQEAIVETLTKKMIRAAKESKAKSIILCGGVAANSYLRDRLAQNAAKEGLQFFVPDFSYNGDNAAMIAAAGYMVHLRRPSQMFRPASKKKFPFKANGNLGI